MVRHPDSVCERVVHSVATDTNTDPIELPPLYDAIDPDALNTIVQTMTEGEICFQYAGATVTVQSDGSITTTNAFPNRASKAETATDD